MSDKSEINILLYQCLTYLGVDFSKFHTDINERIKSQKFCFLLSNKYDLSMFKIFKLFQFGPYNENIEYHLFDIASKYEQYQLLPSIIEQRIELMELLNKINSVFSTNEETTIHNLITFTTFLYIQTYYPSYSIEEQFKLLYQNVRKYFTKDCSVETFCSWKKTIFN